MKAAIFALFLLASASGTIAAAGPTQEVKPIHGQGCVEAGVEARCLVVKDLKSGVLYNLLIKGAQPAPGTGVEFTGVPFEGMTVCMQGTPVTVTAWKRLDTMQCTPAAPQKP